LQLKGFWMRIRWDFCDFFHHQVQNLKCAASSESRYFSGQKLLSSKADDDMLAAGVIADIVGIQIKRYSLQKLKARAVENLHRAVAAACHEEAICGRIVVRSLRFV